MCKISKLWLACWGAYAIASSEAAFAGRICTDNFATDAKASITIDDGARVLYGAIGWIDIEALRRGVDDEGRRHYVFFSRGGERQIYRETSREVDVAAAAPDLIVHHSELRRVDSRGRPRSEPALNVTIEEKSSPGRVVETWTFRKNHRTVILTLCDPAEERAAYPPHPSSSP